MKLALPIALVALVIGYVIGTSVERRRVPAAESRAAVKSSNKTSTSMDSEIAMPPAAESSTELAKAKERIAKLEAQLGKPGKEIAKPGLTAEAAKAKFEELKATLPALLAKKDGKALIKLMQDLAAVGEIGYLAAIEISDILSKDVHQGKNQLGIAQNEYYKGLSGPMIAVMSWGLQKGDEVSATFRAGAAWGLPWHPDTEPGKIFLELLKSEKNPDVLQAISHNLDEVAKAGMEGDLTALVPQYAENRQMLQSIVDSLARIGTSEATAAMEALARSPIDAVRTEAEIGLTAMHPPEAGILITTTVANSQAESLGLKRGDILTSYNGQPVTDLEALRTQIKNVAAGTVVTIMVNRKGSSVPVQIKGGERLGIDGKGVKPR